MKGGATPWSRPPGGAGDRETRLFTPSFVRAWIASFAQAISFNALLHLPGFLLELGADAFVVGVVMSLFGLVAVAVRIPIGWVTDRHGRRIAILLAGVLNVGSCALYLLVSDLGPLLYGVRLLHGFAAAVLTMSFYTLAADGIPETRRAQGLGIFGLSAMGSVAVGGLLGELLIARGGYAALFLFATVTAAISLLLSLRLRETPRQQEATPPSLRDAGKVVGQADLVPVWTLLLLLGFAYSIVFTFAKAFTVESGIGSAGSFFAAYSLATVGVRVLFGWIADHYGQRRVLIPALLLTAAGTAYLAQASSPLELILAGALAGMGHGFSMPVISATVVARAPAALRGAAIGLQFTLLDGGSLLAGPTLGLTIRAVGYPTAFLAVSALVLLALGAFLALDRRLRRRIDPCAGVAPDLPRAQAGG